VIPPGAGRLRVGIITGVRVLRKNAQDDRDGSGLPLIRRVVEVPPQPRVLDERHDPSVSRVIVAHERYGPVTFTEKQVREPEQDDAGKLILDCRAPIREALTCDRLGEDHMVDLAATIAGLGETAMTAGIAIEMGQNGLPNTFVPGRNLLFFTFAAALGYRRGIKHLVGGMCETDYSGYPDCRDDTLKALQATLSLGTDHRFAIHTPLMWRDKAATWELAHHLGGERLVELVRDATHSCYRGDRAHRHEWGYGCGTCPACELRAAGWRRWREGRRQN